MLELVTLTLDGEEVRVPAGTTVAAALANRGRLAMRRSVRGHSRAPLCGMGICFECRATVDGRVHVRTCMTPCRDGMEVLTSA
ncbi:MAG TPA: (2Fe-2S)-binding protein [Thermoanaerobaculia bacterium]|nr:(2Fe-2S)-binding protein [Thermoanaerobaculia bacterium]